MTIRILRTAIALVSAALFVASLTQPSYVCGPRGSWLGYEVLLIGPFAIFGLDPRWFANPLLVYAWGALIAPKRIEVHWAVPLALAVTAATTVVILSPIGCPDMDTPTSAQDLAAGAWLWVSALLVSAIGLLAVWSTLQQDPADADC